MWGIDSSATFGSIAYKEMECLEACHSFPQNSQTKEYMEYSLEVHFNPFLSLLLLRSSK